MIWEIGENRKGLRRPIGIRGHIARNQEMGMEAEGDGGIVWNERSMRHMLTEYSVIRKE